MRPRPTYEVFLTGGLFLGPARTLQIALDALGMRARTAPAGVPVGTIWERSGAGHHHVVRTVYGEREVKQEIEKGIEKEIDRR